MLTRSEVEECLHDYTTLWSEQGNFRNLWQVTAQFVMPAWDNFVGEYAPGVNRNTRIFDSTAVIANERFAAAMEAMMTPRSQVWHKIRAADPNLRDIPAVKRWLEEVNRRMFAARYHPEANYASQVDECYMSLGAFGNNVLYIDEVPGKCLRYRSIPLSELCWALNHQGQVDSIYRVFEFTAKQAVDQWSLENVPKGVQEAFAKSKFTKLKFLHVIRPNPDFHPLGFGRKGHRYECIYVELASKQVVEHTTYRSFPCAIGRYRVAPREPYGRGPATTCFPDVRTANEMVKTGLRIGQKAADPPVLLSEDSVLVNFNQRPGANNYGMVSSDGKPLAIPWETKGNFELSHELLEGTRSTIKDTFLNTLFQILVENPNMTATEALLRAQEKSELIAPVMGRQQSEFLGNQIHREYDVLRDAGQLPPMPVELVRAGGGFDIEYTSPLARAMRAEEGTSIMNTVTDIATIANLDPTVKVVMDYHNAVRRMADIRGCPQDLIRSEPEAQEILEAMAEQQQQQVQATQAPQVAAGVKNLADAARSISQAGVGAGVPPSNPELAAAA